MAYHTTFMIPRNDHAQALNRNSRIVAVFRLSLLINNDMPQPRGQLDSLIGLRSQRSVGPLERQIDNNGAALKRRLGSFGGTALRLWASSRSAPMFNPATVNPRQTKSVRGNCSVPHWWFGRSRPSEHRVERSASDASIAPPLAGRGPVSTSVTGIPAER